MPTTRSCDGRSTVTGVGGQAHGRRDDGRVPLGRGLASGAPSRSSSASRSRGAAGGPRSASASGWPPASRSPSATTCSVPPSSWPPGSAREPRPGSILVAERRARPRPREGVRLPQPRQAAAEGLRLDRPSVSRSSGSHRQPDRGGRPDPRTVTMRTSARPWKHRSAVRGPKRVSRWRWAVGRLRGQSGTLTLGRALRRRSRRDTRWAMRRRRR